MTVLVSRVRDIFVAKILQDNPIPENVFRLYNNLLINYQCSLFLCLTLNNF